MAAIDNPLPVAEIESVLAWVDTFKLSRPTKKINRDFSDAVLLAEMLSVHYPKLVEMHNYPPRNSLAMKLNNWMTLNRKVLKKLKLSLCSTTMEQLANSYPGIIERVLVMVRDKVIQDEEAKKQADENQMSSGGSYYEAYGDEDNVLIVPLKTRVNGVLETVQQKVVNYNMYVTVKEELKDAKDNNEVMRQKVEHLETLIKLKDERIEELQKQLERKAARRKDTDVIQNNYAAPATVVANISVVQDVMAPYTLTPNSMAPNLTEPSTVAPNSVAPNTMAPTLTNPAALIDKEPSPEPSPKSSQSQVLTSVSKIPSLKSVKSEHLIPHNIVPVPKLIEVLPKSSTKKIKPESKTDLEIERKKSTEINVKISKENMKNQIETSYEDNYANMDRVNSDIFKELENESVKSESDDFKDSEADVNNEIIVENHAKELLCVQDEL